MSTEAKAAPKKEAAPDSAEVAALKEKLKGLDAKSKRIDQRFQPQDKAEAHARNDAMKTEVRAAIKALKK